MPEENTENNTQEPKADGQRTPEQPAPKQPEQKAGDPPKEQPKDEPLGEGGKKALQAERDARKELENQLNSFRTSLAEALGGKPSGDSKSEIQQLSERLATHEEQLATEREARWRAEVAHEKGLTAQQAARLVGTTREELVQDADALMALFPATQPNGTPKPDMSQGAKGGGTAATDLDSRIAEAEEKGDTRTAIALKARKLTQQK